MDMDAYQEDHESMELATEGGGGGGGLGPPVPCIRTQ